MAPFQQTFLKYLPDRIWLDYLVGDRPVPAFLSKSIPQMPSEKIQLHFTGASGRKSLMQALDFLNLALESISTQKIKYLEKKTVLDFGCGWGRITRMWLKVVPGSNIYAVDPMEEMITLCKETIPSVHFYLTNPAPPISEFADKSFDFLTAYSVFSHLNEEYLNLWLNEFARLVKPGGMMFITTRSRKFIDHLQQKKENNSFAEYEDALKNNFPDLESALRDYDQGKVFHQPIGGGTLSTSFYGETCVPEAYFHRFEDKFEMVRFIPNLKYEDNQACVILRRK